MEQIFLRKEELLEERNHVFEKHPRTNFVALHVANWPENLDAVSTWPKISQHVGGVWRSRGGTWAAAATRAPILHGIPNTDSEPVRELL